MKRSAALLAALLLAAACGGGRGRPDIVLITLDTVRTDHLGCYGAAGAATPNVDRIAAESVVFEKAFCQAPITRPSHASMLTSRYPRSHAVMNNQIPLSADPVILPEFLRAAGYRTAAFTGVRLLSPKGGFARGFDHFSMPAQGTRTRPAEETVSEVAVWLDEARGDSPLFLWVHFFDAHFPYHFDGEAEGSPDLPPYQGPIRTGTWEEIGDAAGDSALGATDRERMAELYSAKIKYLDHWLGKLRALLDERGIWNDSEVFVLSDHGEGFEKGVYLEHVTSLYGPVSGIAFLWKRPGAAGGGGRIDETVQEIDLMPTALDATGLKPPAGLEGRSLVPVVSGMTAAPGEPVYAFTEEPPLVKSQLQQLSMRKRFFFDFGDGWEKVTLRASGERISVSDGRWRYIFDSEGGDEFYNLRIDPAEMVNRADSAGSDELPRFRHALKRWRESHPLPDTATADSLDAETRDLLESLGYL